MLGFRIYILLAMLIGAAVTAIVIPMVIAFCRKYGYFDQPGQRKVHKQAIPRLGGLAFMPSLALSFVVTMLAYYSDYQINMAFHPTAALMVVGASIIYLVGILDDLLDLPAKLKFMIMTVGALALPVCNLTLDNLHGFFGLYEIPMWVAYPLTVLVILTVVNAINLIDGIDGLASGISAICLAVFLYLFADKRYITFGVLSSGMLGSVVVFMAFNLLGKVGRLKIFMGDAGSLILGYVLSYLAIKYIMIADADVYIDRNPILIAYSLFIVPVFDLVRVAITRIASGEPMMTADQRHIHHVLMRSGLSMRKTLVVILLMVLGFIFGNLWLDDLQVPLTIIFFLDLALYLMFFVVAFIFVDRREALSAM